MRSLLILFTMALLPTFVFAQLLEVRQTIFGMDCAPCAYGVEKALKRLEGVKSVKMSLNNGSAGLKLEPVNNVTLDQIHRAVKENGFTAKDAWIRITGTLNQKDGMLVLAAESGEPYLVSPNPEARQKYDELKKTDTGKRVTVAGLVSSEKRSPTDPWKLQVVEIF